MLYLVTKFQFQHIISITYWLNLCWNKRMDWAYKGLLNGHLNKQRYNTILIFYYYYYFSGRGGGMGERRISTIRMSKSAGKREKQSTRKIVQLETDHEKQGSLIVRRTY